MSNLTKWMHRHLALTLMLPPLVAYWSLAHLLAWIITLAVIPSHLLAQKLYWACPFIPFIFRRLGPVSGALTRIGFEASYCINFYTRLLTIPIRQGLGVSH
jgi:hypothetical protein